MNESKLPGEIREKQNPLKTAIRNRSHGFKTLIIAALLLLFLIPLSFVRSIVSDRQSFKRDAINSILSPLGGELSVNGFALIIEFYKPMKKSEENSNGSPKTSISYIMDYLIISPSQYELKSKTTSSNLIRGIFSVPIYSGTMDVLLKFDIPENTFFSFASDGALKNNVFLAMGLSNNKNIRGFPRFTANTHNLKRKETKEDLSGPYSNAVQFDLNGLVFKGKSLEINGKMDFQGGNALHLAPLACDSRFSVESDWKTPSFSGGWLPSDRELNDSGFNADWQIAGISTSVDPISTNTQLEEKQTDSDKITVTFFTPIESYQKTERSIKYALLFLLIPFLTFFLGEIFINTRIHPVQYCLIGLANVVFYLLLLSLSEHLSFNTSYIFSAIAVTMLTSIYSAAIFQKLKWALIIALVQVISYIFLFGTLQAEDYALLIGSLGLFSVIAGLMLITRKIDWYTGEKKL